MLSLISQHTRQNLFWLATICVSCKDTNNKGKMSTFAVCFNSNYEYNGKKSR